MTDPARINILISRVINQDRPHFTGLYLTVRYGYSPISEEGYPQFADRRHYIPLPMATRYDPAAINNLGQRGAEVVVVDPLAVEAAVASLRAEWNGCPVQDNSGRFPHLATAPGVLIL